MKKIIHTLAVLPSTLLAQPTIPLVDIPNPGEVMTVFDMDDEPMITSGANQTWVIGGVAQGGFSYTFISPSFAPGSSNFPTASVAIADDLGEDFAFFSTTGGDLNHLGTYDDQNGLASPLINPWLYMKYPCTMGTQWTDTYAYQGQPAETVSYVADGYGTLSGPGGSLNNVLKIRSAETVVDTMINGIHHEMLEITDRFWRPGETFHVAVVFEIELRQNGVMTDEYFTIELKSSLVVGVEEHNADAIGVQASPNPATDRITLTFGAQGAVRIDVIDALGQVMGAPVQRIVAPGVSTEELSVQGWPAGHYCARITMENGDQGSVRFVVR